MPDGSERAGGQRRRERSRKDKAGSKRADEIDDVAVSGNVTAHDTESLCERAFDDVDTVHGTIACGNARTAGSVETDAMNFVEVSERAVFLRQIANRRDRTEIGIHRIDGFERDQLWKFWVGTAKQLFKVRNVVVTEEMFFCATVTNSLDHRGVIKRVRLDN